MPKGVPRFGHRTEPAPQSEVLGVIPSDHKVLDPAPQGAESIWQTATGGGVSFNEEPPPWELAGGDDELSDARRYVDAPNDVTLRWINPKLLDSQGWRYWRPVMKSDARFTVKVDQMVSPDGNIRRGGATGDILAFMPTHWVESRRKILEQKTRDQSQSAVDRQAELDGKLREMSPFLHVDAVKHPRYTNADLRGATD
jgi:hypothetical protein